MVLIVSQKLKNAVSLSDIFYYMRILSYPCNPGQALSEISTLYHAVLVIEPNNLPDQADFVKKLRSLAPVPVFAISNEPKKCKCPHVFDKVFTNSILSGNLARQMMEYLYKNHFPPFGNYICLGLDLRCYNKDPTYCFRDIDLTKTERMVLSYLALASRKKQPPENILKYAFPYNRKPSISCVRSHISKINIKFQNQFSKKILGNTLGEGYFIFPPEE